MLIIGCLVNWQKSFAQTVIITSANSTGTNGVDANPLVSGKTGSVLFGFTITSVGTVNINQIVLNASNAYVNNAVLYRSTAGSVTFSGSTQIATIGTLGTYISINGLNETITNTSYTYFIVGDITGIPSYVTLPTTLQFTFSSAIRSSPYTSYGGSPANFTGINYTINNPTYTLTGANTAGNGVTQGTVLPGQTGVVLFGFSIAASANTTVTGFNFNSSSTGSYLSNYLGNGKLYRSTSSTFSVGTATLLNAATVAFSNYQHTPGVAITGLTESITTTAVYYFVVADFNQTSGTLPANIQLNFSTTQTNAVVQSVPNSANIVPSSNIAGSTITFSNPTYTITSANAAGNGITQGAIYPGQAGIVLYGFGVSASGAAAVTGFNLYNTYNQGVAQAYFNNGKIYRSTSSTFSVGTSTLLSGATVAFGSGSTGITISGLTESYTANASPIYYFIVGDFNTGYYGAVPATSQFSLSTSLTNSIVQSSPTSANIAVTSTTNGTTFSLSAATLSVAGYNSTSNGITVGPIAYGQTNIVLFGFSVTVGGTFVISQIDIPSSISAGPYFTNGKLYRSTTNVYANATLVSGTTISFGSPTTITGLSQTLSSLSGGTPTYYYFLVGDFTASTSFTAPATLQYNFANGTNSFIQNTPNPYIAINTPNTTNGTAFSIINSENWTGGTSTSFTNAANFTAINGGGGTVPGSTMVVKIGTYTNAPLIAANTTIGGLTFTAGTSPTINIASGNTLTLNSALNVLGTPTIAGPGAISLTAAATANIASSATLTLSGGANLSNAGTFTMASTSVLNLTGNATVANTGTFILASDANGVASIGQITGTSAVTGTYIVQRYITGGSLTYRGYRLLSSPVHSGSTAYYDLGYLKGSGSYLSGMAGGGWDVTGNPTLYLYRQDWAPNNTSFTSGNFRPITAINNSPNAYLLGTQDGPFNMGIGNGYLMFYRGNNGTLTTTIPNSLVFNASGTINKGPVLVKPWLTGSNTLGYSSVTGNSAVIGFNLVGNPFPSTIDWETYSASTSTNGIYAPNVGNTVYIVDPVSQGYATYQAGSHASAHNGSRYIPSGQGFFVQATNASASLTFNENAKVTNQVTGTSLLLNTTANNIEDKHLRLQLYKDDVVKDDIYIGFRQNASTGYIFNEDALTKPGNSKINLSSLSSDNFLMGINFMPLSAKAQTIPLIFSVNAVGTFRLNMTEAINIPDMFDIWLMDNYKKDSLDIKHNPGYSFNVTADTASVCANRFKVVIRPNATMAVHLLSFSGTKAAASVNLNWKVENEANYTQYILERTTDAGKTYNVLDSLTSANLGMYNDIDPSPVIGLNQYRLKQIDVLGNVSYSNIINIMYSPTASNTVANNLISVYPNPVSSTLNLAITATGTAASYKITITNSAGVMVKTAASSNPDWHSDVNDLPPGSYFIQVINTKDNTVTGKSTFIKL